MLYDPMSPLAACRICGSVYQSKLHRLIGRYRNELGIEAPDNLIQKCLDDSDRWREAHAKFQHTLEQIEAFERSGMTFTPEAANALSTFGIITLDDPFVSQETNDAMFEAPRAPIKDVEC